MNRRLRPRVDEDTHVVHVRYDGQSHDVPFSQLFPADRFEQLGIPQGTEVTAFNVGTGPVRAALANHFDRSAEEFADYVVEPHENGNMTVRPKASFGL